MNILFALVLLSAGYTETPEIHAPKRLTLVGYVSAKADIWNWNGEQRKVYINGPLPYEWTIAELAFFHKSLHDQAVRYDTALVHCRGFWVSKGTEKIFIVESLQLCEKKMVEWGAIHWEEF